MIMPSNSDGARATVPRVKSTNSCATLEPLPDQPMTGRESGSNATVGHACVRRVCDGGPVGAAGCGGLCRPGGTREGSDDTCARRACLRPVRAEDTVASQPRGLNENRLAEMLSNNSKEKRSLGKRCAYLLTLPTTSTPALPPLLPRPPARFSNYEGTGSYPLSAESIMAFTSPTKSFKEALLTPAKKPKPTPPPKPFRPPRNSCFRCLAPDHYIAQCRDPIRCRRCGASGHRARRRKMPIQRASTPYPGRRREPRVTRITVPAHPVHDEPESSAAAEARSPAATATPRTPTTFEPPREATVVPTSEASVEGGARPDAAVSDGDLGGGASVAASSGAGSAHSNRRSLSCSDLSELMEIHCTTSPTSAGHFRIARAPAGSWDAPLRAPPPAPPAPPRPRGGMDDIDNDELPPLIASRGFGLALTLARTRWTRMGPLSAELLHPLARALRLTVGSTGSRGFPLGTWSGPAKSLLPP